MRSFRSWLLLACLVPVTGCFGALADLDSYTVGGGGDFRWHLFGYAPHAISTGAMPQAVGLRIIDESNHVAAMAVFDPLSTPDAAQGRLSNPLDMTSIYHVQIFADLNRDRMLEAYPTDHTWDLPYVDHLVGGEFQFTHGMPFNVVDTVASRANDPDREDGVVMIGGRVLSTGRILHMIVTEVVSTTLTREVVFYRYLVRDTTDPLPMPDVFEQDTTYVMNAFLDLDEDGMHDTDEPTFEDTEVVPTDGTPVQFVLDLSRPRMP